MLKPDWVLRRSHQLLTRWRWRNAGTLEPKMLPIGPAIAVPFGYRPETATRKTAVVAHIFYPELTGTIADMAGSVGDGTDLLITTDHPEKVAAIAAVLEGRSFGRVEIALVPNRGRDWYGKLITFADRYEQYDLLLFLHSKKSHYAEDHEGRAGFGGRWRDSLFESLAGSLDVVTSIFALFDADPALGIVFPQHPGPVRPHLGWGANRALAGELVRRMGGDLDQASGLDFPAGSMFWARPRALAKLLSLGIRDFPRELGQVDGTLAHALERLPLFAAEAGGMTGVKVGVPDVYPEEDSFLEVRGAADVPASLRRATVRLLA